MESTNGSNSATILIADRRGREEIAKLVRKLPGSAQRRFGDRPPPGLPRNRAVCECRAENWPSLVLRRLLFLLAVALFFACRY